VEKKGKEAKKGRGVEEEFVHHEMYEDGRGEREEPLAG